VKYLIRRIKLTEAQELAAAALANESSSDIRARASAFVRDVAPSLFENQGMK
jgi:signal transduction protein with GAF and PtsI domain